MKVTATVAKIIDLLTADADVLHVKTKNFHRRVCGPNFPDFRMRRRDDDTMAAQHAPNQQFPSKSGLQ
jgi:hypothetical protein